MKTVENQTRVNGVSIASEWPLWIGGREAYPHEESFFVTVNPATGKDLCRVALAKSEEVDLAVQAAGEALAAWRDMPTNLRRRTLLDVARAIRDNVDELAILETLNNGKPLREARQDAEKSAEAFEFYAGAADKLFGSSIADSPSSLSYTLREPLGVTAHISPWNYPLRLAVRGVAPALAAGNTVVLKPAEQTPLTALRLAEIMTEAGVPDGVFNVIPGLGSVAGAYLVRHPGIHHVTFTGSVPTGIDVMRGAAGNVTPVTLELGGKSPNIVFSDADLDRSVQGCIKAIFTNAGQV